MQDVITVEVIGLRDSSCSPFPCDEDRTCGLSDCYPTGTLCCAFDALKTVIDRLYGTRVSLVLTLIDEEVPEHVRHAIEESYPPLPFILVNGKVVPIGRISLPLIKKEIDRRLEC
ncbi:MAG TPA: hypothetical protein VMC42_02675 [Methanoregulaceae archaeon]|nr:hypothetical protein [Methanoregulaceae archaeon]